MARKTKKEIWDSLTDAAKDEARQAWREGKSLDEALEKGRTHDQASILIGGPIVLGLVVGGGITIFNFFHNNCLHKDLNPRKYQFDYEHENFEVWCRDCDRYVPKYTNEIEEITKEPTCLEKGTKSVTYKCKEFPQLTITVDEEIN